MQYWLVGAMYGGQDDQAERFLRRGYWHLGWNDEEKPAMASLRNDVKPGDRVAIKKMMGQGSPTIRVTALGIVTDVDTQERRIYVNWLLRDLDRIVESRGCYGSIHGPFRSDDEWIQRVFLL